MKVFKYFLYRVKYLKMALAIALCILLSLSSMQSFASDRALYKDKIKQVNAKNIEVIKGKNRVETSVAISRRVFSSAKSVIIVSGKVYADSISSIYVSSMEDAPILITMGKNLEPSIRDEVKRLKAERAIIVGGSSSVSSAVEEKLKNLDGIESVTRISGKNRYDTNMNIFKSYDISESKKAMIVSGENFADAISAGAYAHKNKFPIILAPKVMDSGFFSFLKGKSIEKFVALGGTASISGALDRNISNLYRYSGVSRYDTSYMFNRDQEKNEGLVLTSGENFADAMAGSVYASKRNMNMVLFNQNPNTYQNIYDYDRAVVLGGELGSKVRKNIVNRLVFDDDYVAWADRIIAGTFPLYENGDRTISYNGNFRSFSSRSRNEQRRVFAFFFLSDLTNAYIATGDKKYVNSGINYIRKFESELSDDIEMMWHDETTARRLMSYLYFYVNSNHALRSSDKNMMLKSMNLMARKMAYTDFWSGNNNHGYFQDNAVMRYANFVGDSSMFRIAANRAADYFLNNFDEEGVHMENSPEYHFVLLEELKNYVDSISSNVSRYNEIKRIYDRSYDFSNAVVMPNSYLPNLGDTGMIKVDLEKYYERDPIDYRYETRRATFLKSGYDILKGSDTYLLFRGGALRDYHRHNDDLSFWLYKNGVVFSEVGAFGYEYSNSYAQYVKSFEAHNTLIVDDKNETTRGSTVLFADDRGTSSSETVEEIGGSSYNSEGFSSLPDVLGVMRGSTDRIKGVKFNRSIAYGSDLSRFVVRDRMISLDKKNHNYKLLFHLDPSVKAKMNSRTVELYRNGNIIGKVSSDGNMSIKNDVFFKTYGAIPQGTDLIVVEINGKDVDNETVIDVY